MVRPNGPLVKRCENPKCGKEFARRDHEKLNAFRKRKACCFACGVVISKLSLRRNAAERRRATFGREAPSSGEIFAYAQEQAERFWKKVLKSDPDACWPWGACINKNGYGKFGITLPTRDGKQRQAHVGAHRLAWELANGEPLGDRLATHSCDNPPCCNPRHISPGTCLSNMRDKVDRGRGRYPGRIPDSVKEEALRLREVELLSPLSIALRLGISEGAARNIVKRGRRVA